MVVRQIQDLVADTLPLVIALRNAEGRSFPKVVERDLKLFLTCGKPQRGHAVLACRTCRIQRTIAFTCKRRSLCVRCINRRREERTPHLMNKVLRDVPYRHWVLCLPFELRHALGYYPALITRVLARFVASIFSLLRKKALLRYPWLSREMLHPAALSVRHRVSANLATNLHFHCLVPEGVYVQRSPGGSVEFYKLRPPTHDEIAAVAVDTCRRTRRLLARTRPSKDSPPYWENVGKQPGGGAVRGILRLREPHEVTFYGRAVKRNDGTPPRPGADPFDVYAGSRVEEGDRAGRENLVRYLLAPPFKADQLSFAANGDVILRLKRPRRDGSTEERLTPHEFVEAMIALVPRPRSHGIGYHGALARNAHVRKFVIPQQRTRAFGQIVGEANDAETPEEREAWKQLHARAHRQDFLACPVCCDRLVLVGLVGEKLQYQNPHWVAPDTPTHLAEVPSPTETKASR